MRQFIVARNPDQRSALPFIIHIPLMPSAVWLKAAASWPRNARVYCHPLRYAPRLEALEVLERVDVVSCRRIGPAIDLILGRRTNKRSQIVFVHSRGRDLIFWQTAQSARAARPGVRIPSRHAEAPIVLCADTRERYGYRFASHGVTLERRELAVGDYAAFVGDAAVAVVERKRIEDLATSLVDGSLNFVMSELATGALAAVAVEGTYSSVLRHHYTRAGFLPELVARLQLRYPHVSINFLESRKIAEEWTYRFLRTAYTDALAEQSDPHESP